MSPKQNHLTVPKTPRGASHGSKNSISFGLGFSPSFPFTSPGNLNIFNSFSPQRFLLNHGVEDGSKAQTFTPPDSQVRRKIFSTPGGEDKLKEIWEIFPDLDSKKDDMNATLTSIHEEDKENDMLSQDETTLISPSLIYKQPLSTPLIEAHSTVKDESEDSILHDTQDEDEDEEDHDEAEKHQHIDDSISEHSHLELKMGFIRPPLSDRTDQVLNTAPVIHPSSSFLDHDEKTIKKRKLSSPSVSGRSMSISSNYTPSLEKVWTEELDFVLLQSLKKIRDYKKKRPTEKLAQNKVISKIILEKTGVMRTSKQIASRINYLHKRKCSKASLENGPNIKDLDSLSPTDSISDEMIDNIMKTTPFDNYMNTPNDSMTFGSTRSEDMSILDREIESILSSSPLILPQPSSTRYELIPESFDMKFNFTVGESFRFTKYGEANIEQVKTSSIANFLEPRINSGLFEDLSHHNSSLDSVPIFVIESKLASLNEPLNLINGSFDSNLTFNVRDSSSVSKNMLSWKCATRVYDNNQLLLNLCEHINGYKNFVDPPETKRGHSSFHLKVPFVSSFWSGFLSYISNGGNSSLEDISVVQFIYEGEEKNKKHPGISGMANGKIHSCLIYTFNRGDCMEGSTVFKRLVLESNGANVEESPNGVEINLKSDDNTVDLDDEATVAGSPRGSFSHPNSSPVAERRDSRRIVHENHQRQNSNPQQLSIEVPASDINQGTQNLNLGLSQQQFFAQPSRYPSQQQQPQQQQPLQVSMPMQQPQYLMQMNHQQQQVLNNSLLLQQQMIQSQLHNPQAMALNQQSIANFNGSKSMMMMNQPTYLQTQFSPPHPHSHYANMGLRSAPAGQTTFFVEGQSPNMSNNGYRQGIEIKPNVNSNSQAIRTMSNGNLQFQFYKPN